MATTMRIHLNSAAVRRMLKSEAMKRRLKAEADKIAAAVDAQHLVAEGGWERIGIGPEITAEVIESERRDRAVATVRIDHPAGRAMQARHGVMSKAVSSAT